MKTIYFIFILGVGLAIGMASLSDEPKGQITTKVAENSKNGIYRRVTETFRDNILISKEEEGSTDGSGGITLRAVFIYSNGELVYSSVLEIKQKRFTASFWKNKALIAQEGKEDVDGGKSSEELIFFDTKEKPVMAFERKQDGSVAPFSEEKFSRLKKAFAFLDEGQK